ncbi:MAG: MiaB/RimO family radical SAM methylthiotransferase, partial [Oscillospiraceae bacterium]|nr:MiaB/RimO family radical SAM methylthiotransferase [Oscillospiraceae bacterium]
NIETGARLSTNTRAYIKIQDGCDCRCSYCVIPQVRGPARSRGYEQIASEAGRLCELGCFEIVLTGIEISSYGKDLGTKGSGLIELLEKLGSEPKLNRLKSIRLSSLDPSLLKKDFVDALAQLELLAPHFHLSLQSGSTAILNKMRRKYTAEVVLENLDYARQKIRELNLTSDIIVGFPGETEEDFDKTLEMVKYLDIYHAHIFKYSKRPGTEAASFGDQVDERSKNSRSQIISSACGQIKERMHKNNIGKIFEAILEEQDKDGFYVAKTKNFMDLKITPKNNAALVGSIQKIQSVDCDKNYIYGKIKEEQNGI